VGNDRKDRVLPSGMGEGFIQEALFEIALERWVPDVWD
jgi:hypothetical protein